MHYSTYAIKSGGVGSCPPVLPPIKRGAYLYLRRTGQEEPVGSAHVDVAYSVFDIGISSCQTFILVILRNATTLSCLEALSFFMAGQRRSFQRIRRNAYSIFSGWCHTVFAHFLFQF